MCEILPKPSISQVKVNFWPGSAFVGAEMITIVGSPDLEAETVGKVAKLREERARTAIITGMKTREPL